jgi:hypothetical protein
VTNEVDDRLYLAANNGLVVCLHERSRTKPETLMAKKVKAPAPKAEAPMVEPKKEPEAKKDPEPEPKKDPVPPKKAPEEKKAELPKKAPEAKKGPEPKKTEEMKKE